MILSKVVNYLKGVALAIAGKEKKQDLGALSSAVILTLRERGFEVKKIQDKVPNLTPEEILDMPAYFLKPEDPNGSQVTIRHVFQGLWADSAVGWAMGNDPERQARAAIAIMHAFISAGYVRVSNVPPPRVYRV